MQTPLKAAIQWRDEHPREKAPPWFSLVMLFYTCELLSPCSVRGADQPQSVELNLLLVLRTRVSRACLMTQWGLFIWATDLPSKVWYSASGNTIVASVMFLVAIVCYFPISHGRGGQSMIGWLVLLMIYLPRIFAKVRANCSEPTLCQESNYTLATRAAQTSGPTFAALCARCADEL